jgi:hypothetical protein
MRPISDAGDQAVLDRIDVTILDVAAEILIVADQMFPEPTLPDGAFAVRNADRAPPLGLWNGLGEVDFDQPQRNEKSASPGGSVQTAWR